MEEQLIELVKANPLLYNTASTNYRNVFIRNLKWKEIANEIGIDVEKIRKRWRTLRDRFWKEDKKRKLTLENGATSYILWKYFDSMQFLRDCPKRKKTPKNLQELVDELQEPEIDIDFKLLPTTTTEINRNETNNDNFIETITDLQTLTTDIQTRKLEKIEDKSIKDLLDNAQRNFSSFIERAKEMLDDASQSTPLEDMFKSIAQQIQMENLPLTVLMEIQQEILGIISDKIRNYRMENGA